VRAALHAAFVALQAQSTQIFQDWAALVGYVHLPEDYTQYHIDVTLQGDLAALEVTKEWFNPVGGNSRSVSSWNSGLVNHLRSAVGACPGASGSVDSGVH
jgi:hypothetical protein